MTIDTKIYKLEKYRRKLYRVGLDHPSFHIYLNKYIYYLNEGGGKTAAELAAEKKAAEIYNRHGIDPITGKRNSKGKNDDDEAVVETEEAAIEANKKFTESLNTQSTQKGSPTNCPGKKCKGKGKMCKDANCNCIECTNDPLRNKENFRHPVDPLTTRQKMSQWWHTQLRQFTVGNTNMKLANAFLM